MRRIKSLYRFLSPHFQTVHLEFKVTPRPRYGHGKPAHGRLFSLVDSNRDHYARQLEWFLQVCPGVHKMGKPGGQAAALGTSWNNGFLPGLDMVSLYGLLARYKPARYLEIGAGNSTRIARKAVQDLKLETRIISVDPSPRLPVAKLADQYIGEAVEAIENLQFITHDLQAGDILFIDNSHRVFPNSDAMVCFLEILPELKKGVIVHFHDIYLPYDYPDFMCQRFYNEQYMLAAFLLANSKLFNILLPNYFISRDPELCRILDPFWEHPDFKDVETHGCSFWFEV